MNLQEATILALQNKLEENYNHTLTGFNFILSLDCLDHLKPLYNEYKELDDKSSFYSHRSGGTYKDNDLENRLEELKKELSDKCLDILYKDNVWVVTFNNSDNQILYNVDKKDLDNIIKKYDRSLSELDLDSGKDIFEIKSFPDWYNTTNYFNLGRSHNYIKY